MIMIVIIVIVLTRIINSIDSIVFNSSKQRSEENNHNMSCKDVTRLEPVQVHQRAHTSTPG